MVTLSTVVAVTVSMAVVVSTVMAVVVSTMSGALSVQTLQHIVFAIFLVGNNC